MFLGLDIGSTALKAAVFDASDGSLLAQADHKLALDVDASGRREQDPAELQRALCAAAASLRRQIGGQWTSLRGMGLATQGGSTLLADRVTGAPRTPIILWNDTRAFGHFHRIAESLPARWWRSFSLRDEPGMGLARALWLREQWPDLFVGNPLCIGVGEHVFFALTGCWRQEACHALQSGCYDARRQRLSNRPAKKLGLPANLFAPLRTGQETHPLADRAAALLHLPPGIPVAGPFNDHEAGYRSVLHASRHPLACSLGTAWVGNFVLPPGFHGRAPFQLCIPAPEENGQQVIMPLLTGNVTLDWALEKFVGADPKTAFECADKILSQRLLPPPGLTALPWLNRPNSLRPSETGSGGFFGIGPATDSSDCFRAVVAGMALELARVLGSLAQGGAVDSLVLCGGAAKSPHLCGLIGALFAPLPIYKVLETELMGTRGCLQGFDPRIACAPTAPAPRIPGLDHTALSNAQALYLDVFNRLSGHVSAGSPYLLIKEPLP